MNDGTEQSVQAGPSNITNGALSPLSNSQDNSDSSASQTIKDKPRFNGAPTTPSDSRSNYNYDSSSAMSHSAAAAARRLMPLTSSQPTNSVSMTSVDSSLSIPVNTAASTLPSINGTVASSPPRHSGPPPAWPMLHLLPLNETFIPKAVSLHPPGAKIKVGRQTNAKTAPAFHNAYFDSKVLSRTHAEVWFEAASAKVFIKDVGSSNGTFINGDRLSLESQKSDVFELHSDDILEFGIDIASEDNKTVLHHKVAAKAYVAVNSDDADRLAKALPSIQMKMGLGPMPGAGLQEAANGQGIRRMSRAGIASSGMSFDHVLTRLQTELQKSRETGSDLSSLNTTMNDIKSQLMPGSGPPPSPPYPMARIPPLQSVNNSNAAISTLQTQLSETQSNLTNQNDKLGKLEGLLRQHELLKIEVADLREQMRLAKSEMDEMVASRRSERYRLAEDDDDDDAQSIASVDTVKPDEDEPLDGQDIKSVMLSDGLHHDGDEKPTTDDESREAIDSLRLQNTDLQSKLEVLSNQLDSATQLGNDLRRQHSDAAQTADQLAARVMSLEQAMSKQQSRQVAQSDTAAALSNTKREDIKVETEAKWESWKAAFETSWKQDREHWQLERDKLQQTIKEWEEKDAKLAAALAASESRTASLSPGKRRPRSKRRRSNNSGSQSASGSDTKMGQNRAAGLRQTILSPAYMQTQNSRSPYTGNGSIYDEDDGHATDSSDGTTTAVFSSSNRNLSTQNKSVSSRPKGNAAVGTAGAIGVAALAFTVWAVVNRGD